MSYATIDALRSQLGGKPAHSPEYVAKMMHTIPPATTVDRTVFILRHVAGKRVLEFGASGPMHDAIVKAAARVIGIDREGDGKTVIGFDLDDVSRNYLEPIDNGCYESMLDESYEEAQVRARSVYEFDIIVCGEILEHLSNPGWFLTRLKRQYSGVPVIITVPNAFASVGAKWVAKGIECVNKDHVSYYSPKTLSVLLERAGYAVGGLFFYGGSGPTAEGLIVVTE